MKTNKQINNKKIKLIKNGNTCSKYLITEELTFNDNFKASLFR